MAFRAYPDAFFLPETSDLKILYREIPLATDKKAVYFRGL